MGLFRKAQEALSRFRENRKGNEIVAVALILIFIILAVAPFIQQLGVTTGEGVDNLNEQMEDVLGGTSE